MEEHWVNLENNFGYKKKSERFSYILYLYSNHNNIDQGWLPKGEEYIQQWKVVKNPPKDPINNIGLKCICSQNIEHLYFIENQLNGNVLMVGSNCICKFGTDEMIETVQSLARQRNNKETLRRQCYSCGKYRIGPTKPDYFIQCKPCYQEKRPMLEIFQRECITCKQKNIPINKYDKIQECIKCYTQRQQRELSLDSSKYRKCVSCDYLIASSEPWWKKQCISCFRKSKNNNRMEIEKIY